MTHPPTPDGTVHGRFIGIDVAPHVAADPALAAQLAEVCPVDIYACADDGALRLVAENLDECVLCGLCEHAAPPGTVKVVKRYEETA
jgi:NAD-dependent dihydropyrimidine dehydrogenase PreA subunit